MGQQPQCLVAMEACASAHHWEREMSRRGHEVRLIAPHFVKPFIKRRKNDAADAEAIVESALSRSTPQTISLTAPALEVSFSFWRIP
jgi:transposase